MNIGKHKDLTGVVFGYLTVLGPTKRRQHGGILWNCRCTCGNILPVATGHLTRGGVKSCKCKRQQLADKTRLKTLSKRKNRLEKGLFAKYKDSATTRKIFWNLNLKHFIRLIHRNCYYCDRGPEKRRLDPSRTIRSSGIDRRINLHKIGYTTRNCVPCCKTCNMMKRTLAATKFVKQVRRIALHLTK